MAGKRYFENGFINTALYKKAVLPMFYVEFTENVFNFLLNPKSTLRPSMVGPGENFQNRGAQKDGKRYIETGFR